ncbi:hypothetical protein FS837_004722 [Tulasnella sp. UAMH 9824]|nr:hypothetical protein FS837_004722 [Tulasnella sp. UAMH 9824]
MAPARSKKVVEEDIQLSQVSNEDDDASRKKKEAEFLRKAKLALDNTVSEHAKAIADSMTEIHDLYIKFQEEHAATNDRIRSAWVAIYEEQQRCKARESGSQGLVLARGSVNDLASQFGLQELVERIAQVDRVAGEEADERMEKQLSALKQCIIGAFAPHPSLKDTDDDWPARGTTLHRYAAREPNPDLRES